MISREDLARLGASYHKIKDFQSSTPVGVDSLADYTLFTVSSYDERKNARDITQMITDTTADVSAVGLKFRIQARMGDDAAWETIFPYTDLVKGAAQNFLFSPKIQLRKGAEWRVQAKTSSGSINLLVSQTLCVDYTLEESE